MEGNESTIVIIAKSVMDSTVSIKQAWQTYGNLIRGAKDVQSDEEAMALIVLYLRQGVDLADNGYWKNSMSYLTDAYSTLEKVKDFLSESQYNNAFEAIIQRRAQVEMHLDNYVDAMKDIKMLKEKFPGKDEYQQVYIQGIGTVIAKYTNPVYFFIGVLFLVWLADMYIFQANIIPHWLVNAAWTVWLIMIVAQFGLPWIIRKL